MFKRVYKILIVSVLFLSMVMSGYSATQNIQQCPVTWVNGDTYVIDNTFIDTSCVVNGNNTLITTNGVDIKKSITFTINGNNNKISNYKSNDIILVLQSGNTNLNFTIENSQFYNMISPLFYFSTMSSYVIFNYYGLNIINNTFITKTNTHFFYTYTGSIQDFKAINSNYYNTNIINNDIIGFNYFAYSNFGGHYFLSNDTISNNNIVTKFLNIKTDGLNTCDLSFNNNYLGFVSGTDVNLDYIDDNLFVLNYGSCNIYSGFPQIKTNLKNSNSQVYTYFSNSPNYYESNKRIYLSTPKILDGLTTGIDFTNVQNTILDLSLLPGVTALTLNNVRTLKMGSNNQIYGGSGNKPIIVTGANIPTSYVEPFAQNNHLIEYINSFTMDNIDIRINHQYPSFISKASFQDRGENLKLLNNRFELNVAPTNTQPLFEIGCNAVIKDNLFDTFNRNDTYLFNGGTCDVGGNVLVNAGHLFRGNTFTNGGIVLQGLVSKNPFHPPGAYSILNEPLKFNYNSLTRFANNPIYNYAQLLDPTKESITNWRGKTIVSNNGTTKPIVNDDYYYKTTCQNYLFNLGNYYQEINDYTGSLLNLTDNNNDGIWDNPISVGRDYQSRYIWDERPLVTFPYNFAGNIAQSVSVSNTCGVLTFDIIKPSQGTTYPSTTQFDSSWKYSSTTYSNLYCKENFNGIISEFSGVNSQEVKSLIYNVTDGVGSFQITCGDTPFYDNIVISSPIQTFSIGSLTTPIIVDPNPIVNPNPGNVNNTNGGGGNTSGGGGNTNGGSSSSSTSYSSIDVIDYNSVDNTNANTIGFMQDIIGFVTNVGIPLGILLVVVISVFAVLRLLM